MSKISKTDIQFLQQRLLDWFLKNRRALPWRKNYDPYQVWISEIMLQQTQVKTMLPYFKRWMEVLPMIADVAGAEENKILKLWEGLGYYSRARNIQKAARKIMNEYNGQFPERYEEILALSGVGKYTACAIASIAFNRDLPVVDGNVARVLSRFFFYTKNVRLPEAEKQMWQWVSEVLPKGRARDFNQALMEFGALQCTPSVMDCGSCPLQSRCRAYKKGMVEKLPDRGSGKKLQNIKVAIAVIRKNGKVFIQKRPEKGLMAGLWEFPGGKVEKGESSLKALCRELKEETGLTVRNVKKIKTIRHAYTSFKVNLDCFEADYDAGRVSLKAASEGRWVEIADLKKYPFPAANVLLVSDLSRNIKTCRQF